MKYVIKGLDNLKRKLAHLEKAGAKRAMRKATRAGTTVLLRAIRPEVPVDEGRLKKLQASKISSKGPGAVGIVGADRAKRKSDAQEHKRPTNIDWLVEYGHVAPDGTFVPPSGYMRRAAASAMPAAEAAYVKKLTEEIEREAAKG